ncbi:MAG: glycosyltransferase family protein [Candidatus Neomarinimicrobiota bacterium]
MKNKTVVYALIDWGLGHVTRSTPIIRRLINDGNRVILVSYGRALAMLRQEFPECTILEVKDTQIRYPKLGFLFVFAIVFQIPKMLCGWAHERKHIKKIVKDYKADLIMTEMRLGFWHKKVPSVLITHQLRFHLPKGLRWAGIFGDCFNRIVFRHFDRVFVPDAAGKPNLSGILSHDTAISRHPKVRHIGCLSSLVPAVKPVEEDIDYLFSISGPEPQRTEFETIILDQLDKLEGKVVVTLGRPAEGNNIIRQDENVTIYAHLNRAEMNTIMQRAKRVICRSGYSTVMELLALGKSAMFVPTPGQTEQEYLATHYQEQGLFTSCRQEDLDLGSLKFYSDEKLREQNIPVNQLDSIMKKLDTLCP